MKSGYTLDKINGTMMLEHMRNTTFLGMTGNVTLDATAERKGYSFASIILND